jgi:heptosyltransferase-1
MRVLLIKTSSLGDVIHTSPALSDACQALPGLRFDWLIEEAYREVPAWHPAVDRVIPVAVRRWRRCPLRTLLGAEWRAFRQELRRSRYDLVLDAQGLFKSAALPCLARGRRAGFDRASARESLATLAYHERIPVARGGPAIERLRI